ncbi:MAG TPA: hypothetical protein VMH84_00350 [Xanthobacteraceae bacterium]|nr:hypothetical protein [Xanthobacteraceae bacterium]
MTETKKSHLFKMALILLGVFAVSGPSLAQTAAETATQWQVLGTWQTDCKAPINELNMAYTFMVRGGQLFLDRNYGRGSDSSPITKATLTADGALVLVINYAQYSLLYENVLVKGGDGRFQMVEIKNIKTNQYSIKDGKKVIDGTSPEWWTRCH